MRHQLFDFSIDFGDFDLLGCDMEQSSDPHTAEAGAFAGGDRDRLWVDQACRAVRQPVHQDHFFPRPKAAASDH